MKNLNACKKETLAETDVLNEMSMQNIWAGQQGLTMEQRQAAMLAARIGGVGGVIGTGLGYGPGPIMGEWQLAPFAAGLAIHLGALAR